jgi:hypothetical protein
VRKKKQIGSLIIKDGTGMSTADGVVKVGKEWGISADNPDSVPAA